MSDNSSIVSRPPKSSCLATPTLRTSSQDCCQSTKKGIPEIHPYSSESPKSLYFRPIELHIYFRLDRRQTVSTWLDRSGLMSVIRNLSRLIWYVPKYLRLFVETYPQILWQKYLDTFCYPYRCLNLARPRKKFNFFIRFYYYSDSNIKVKFCEDPPSSQPCPFFLQRTGQRLF